MWVRSPGWDYALEENSNGIPIPVFLPGGSHGQGSLAGYSPWGRKETDTTEAKLIDTHTGVLLEWFTAAVGNQHQVPGRHGAGGDPDHLLWTRSLL